jgi:alpha-tubulin suppressor-like RCC1 family protein
VAGVVTIAGTGNEFASIFGGNFHVCGVRADGTTRCWGDNGSGQLGVGHTNPVLSPTAVPTLSQVVGGGGGMAQTCWLRANTESLACAGANNHGQLGNGDPTHASQSTPVNVQLGELVFQGVVPFGYFQQVETAFTAGGVVDAGQCHVCAVRNTFSLASFTTQREVVCWGKGDSGQLGHGSMPLFSASPVVVGGIAEPVVALSAGGDHSCALTSGGRVWCWGANSFGQLGIGTNANASTPQLISTLTEVVQITTGQHHTCSLHVNGRAWCWGRGNDGQLGRGTSSDSNVPVEVLLSANTPMTDITSLSAGWSHTCARRVNGEVRCWGEGSFSRNGHPTGKDLLLAGDPLAFPSGFRPVRLSAGEMHTCALSDNGSVACWGGNVGNRLALGSPFNTQGEIESPQIVAGLTGVVGLQGGGSTLCAVKSDGTAQCWGVNASGTVGNGFSGATVTMPTTVTGLSEVVSVTSDCNVSCAMLANGSVRCWGSDSNGSLGNGCSSI